MKKDGGRAFPMTDHTAFAKDQPGMTLRQWYAGMALQGLIASSGSETMAMALKKLSDENYGGVLSNVFSDLAFAHADALIDFEGK